LGAQSTKDRISGCKNTSAEDGHKDPPEIQIDDGQRNHELAKKVSYAPFSRFCGDNGRAWGTGHAHSVISKKKNQLKRRHLGEIYLLRQRKLKCLTYLQTNYAI